MIVTDAVVRPGNVRLGMHATVRATVAGLLIVDGVSLSWERNGRLSVTWPSNVSHAHALVARPVDADAQQALEAGLFEALGVPARFRP